MRSSIESLSEFGIGTNYSEEEFSSSQPDEVRIIGCNEGEVGIPDASGEIYGRDFPVHSYGGDTGLILDRSAHKVVDSEDGTHLAQQTEPNRSSLHNMLMLGTVGVRIL